MKEIGWKGWKRYRTELGYVRNVMHFELITMTSLKYNVQDFVNSTFLCCALASI